MKHQAKLERAAMLSQYHDKVLRAFDRHDELTAGDIAAIAKVPDGLVHSVVLSLIMAGKIRGVENVMDTRIFARVSE